MRFSWTRDLSGANPAAHCVFVPEARIWASANASCPRRARRRAASTCRHGCRGCSCAHPFGTRSCRTRAIAGALPRLPAASRPQFEGSLSTAFGCTLEGAVAPAKVAELAVALRQAGRDEIGLADTTGYAHPRQVTELVRQRSPMSNIPTGYGVPAPPLSRTRPGRRSSRRGDRTRRDGNGHSPRIAARLRRPALHPPSMAGRSLDNSSRREDPAERDC